MLIKIYDRPQKFSPVTSSRFHFFYELQETYSYYKLPFCKPEHGIESHKRVAGIGEVLEGNELRNSGLKLHFASTKSKSQYIASNLMQITANDCTFYDTPVSLFDIILTYVPYRT